MLLNDDSWKDEMWEVRLEPRCPGAPVVRTESGVEILRVQVYSMRTDQPPEYATDLAAHVVSLHNRHLRDQRLGAAQGEACRRLVEDG